MLAFPMILPFWSSANPVNPSSFRARFWNICLSPVISHEHPLSGYQDRCLDLVVWHIFNIDYLKFRYPISFESFLVISKKNL